MAALFATLAEFGFRIGELLNLRVNQIDLGRSEADSWIVLNPGETKSGKGRKVPMTRRVFELLKACVIDKGPDDFVFTRNGKRIIDIRKAWAKVTREVNKARSTPLLVHDMRRYALRRMIRRGIQQKDAMLFSGHRTASVFERYNIIIEDDLKADARKLEPEPTPASLDTVEIQSGKYVA